jgi:hypothetical protein
MNDERFFDLAMKTIARQCTDAERVQLDALLACQPELKAEFERLQAEVRVTKEALPLVEATEAKAGEFPAYARGRLQTKVRQTLGRPEAAENVPRNRERSAMRWAPAAAPPPSRAEHAQGNRERSAMWSWRWVLGLATATAAVALVVIPMFRGTPQPVIQVALLDIGGPSRGGDTNEVALLRQSWQGVAVESFSEADALRVWETNWPAGKGQMVAKIVYDRSAAKIRVQGRTEKATFTKTFPVEPDLASALAQARSFIAEQAQK